MEDTRLAATAQSLLEVAYTYSIQNHVETIEDSNFQRFVCRDENVTDMQKFFSSNSVGDSASCTSDDVSVHTALKIKRCAAGNYSVCLDCEDPCLDVLSAEYGNAFLSPCSYNSSALAGTTLALNTYYHSTFFILTDLFFAASRRTSFKMFLVRFENLRNWALPVVQSNVTLVSRNSISVSVSLSGDGFLYCGLFSEGERIR